MIDRFSWMAIYPEIVLLVMACVITLVDLLDRNPRRMAAYALSVLTLLVLAVLTGTYALGGQTWYGFEGMVVSDPMANWLKCFAALSVAVTLVYARTYVTGRGILRGAEWYVLSLLSRLCFQNEYKKQKHHNNEETFNNSDFAFSGRDEHHGTDSRAVGQAGEGRQLLRGQRPGTQRILRPEAYS